MKFWYELKINGEQSQLSEYESRLVEDPDVLAMTLSAQSEDDEVFEPAPGQFPLWQDNQLTLLFSDETAAFRLISELKLAPEHYELKVLPNEDWIAKCHDLFQPKQFGERIWLYPSWSKPPVPGAINICLDPGMAFGTGEHETTTLCLEWLDKHLQPGASVVDYGCGTAVLAIAAAKLGASIVEAVDIDPQAVVASEENVSKNDVQDLVRVYHTDAFKPAQQYDVVVANILARPLISLKSLFADLLTDEGTLIVSGVLESQLEWILEHYQSDFNCDDHQNLNGWLSICFTKKNS